MYGLTHSKARLNVTRAANLLGFLPAAGLLARLITPLSHSEYSKYERDPQDTHGHPQTLHHAYVDKTYRHRTWFCTVLKARY